MEREADKLFQSMRTRYAGKANDHSYMLGELQAYIEIMEQKFPEVKAYLADINERYEQLKE